MDDSAASSSHAQNTLALAFGSGISLVLPTPGAAGA
jgi:hypothetical protein